MQPGAQPGTLAPWPPHTSPAAAFLSASADRRQSAPLRPHQRCVGVAAHARAHEQVAKLEEIYGLKKYVSQLTYLDLSGNALCEDKSYRPTVLRKMTALCTLDGRRISPAEQAMFGDNAGALTLALVMEHGTAGMRYNVGGAPGPTSPSGLRVAPLARGAQ